MHHCIVIGNPIAHSKSPIIHHEFARQAGLTLTYDRLLCPADSSAFTVAVQAFFLGGGLGINVTLPFKQDAYELCLAQGILSAQATIAKAVNTLAVRDGVLYGDNTDGRGLVLDLRSKGIDLADKMVGIIGAGGAARGAMLPLMEAGANIVLFNRTLQKAQAICDEFAHFLMPDQHVSAKPLTAEALTGHFDLIINATSAGTTDQTLNLAHTKLTCDQAYDMMYGKDTEFLRHFGATAQCFDGLGMLIAQAALGFELWTSISADTLDLAAVVPLLKHSV